MPNVNVVNLSGVGGGIFIDTQLDQQGSFMAFTALEDTVFAEDTIVNVEGLVASQKTIPAGLTVHGNFTYVVLLSGCGILYHKAC